MTTRQFSVEWPTLILIAVTYGLWGAALFWIANWSVLAAILVTAVTIAQQSSLQHEVIHTHPTRVQWINEMLVCLNIGLVIPYVRFKDTHLAHHFDANLTDPYDDPESNYMYREDWARLPLIVRSVLRVNNVLLGRLLFGPLIGQIAFIRSDAKRVKNGDKRVLFAWLFHIPVVVLVVWIVGQSSMPFWAYAIAIYMGQSILKIRTFLEHQAHEKSRARTVVVEDRGPLSILFLNNNFHVVHHMHPRVPWYELPRLYSKNTDRYLTVNDGYRFTCYGQVFRQHLLKTKDQVAHPLWYRDGRSDITRP